MDNGTLINLHDSILAKLASKGDSEALEVLYRRHYALLLNFGLKYNQNRDFVKDCIQDMFVEYLCNPHILENVTYIRSWLLVSLKNEIYDRLKAQKTHIQFEELPFSEINGESFCDNNQEGLDDDEINDRKTLLKAFKHLSGSQRMAIYLHFVKGMTHQEVSAYLNVNVQSSRNLLFRALTRLRAILHQPLAFALSLF